MHALRDTAALIGRILIAYLFVPAGWSKIGGFGGTAGYIASKGLPLPEVGAALAIGVELLAGLMILIGWKTRWAALALALFTAVASFFFHNYWGVPADQQMMQKLLFNKNVAVVGGLLLLYAFGPGRLAIEKS
jgi:putative oxidoreductase